MNRNPFLGLVTIVFLLFSLSPYNLAKASDTDVSVRAVPVAGHWTGTTSRGQPMSFDVSVSGTQWSTFKLKTDFVIGTCSGTVEYTVPGPGAITNDAFSRSLSTFSFNGQFNSPAAASGNYSFTNESVTGCGTFTQSGTWSATTTLPLPGAFSKLTPANTATDQPANLTLSWEASSNATSYEYCYSITIPCTSWVDNGNSTSNALSGLTPGATYYWQVRARNTTGTTLSNGGSVWTFSVTQVQFLPLYLPLVVKAAQLPGSFSKIAPANAANGQSTSPTLSWAPSANATGYEYCYGTTNPCSNWTDNGTATSKALTGLSLATTYYWQVRANSPVGSTYADGGTWWSFTTTATSGPTAGFWQSNTGDEFYVTPDQVSVINFTIYFTTGSCSGSVTRGNPAPILNNQFSFTGSIYASGTFDSPTSAHGTDGLNNYYIPNCGYLTGGPWQWTATWQNSSQPAVVSVDAGSTDSITILPYPALEYHVIDHW